MPSLWFGNLGSMPGNEEVSVTGSLYVLLVENFAEGTRCALVLDLRTYSQKSEVPASRIRFRTIGPFKLPILPPSILDGDGSDGAALPPESALELLRGTSEVYVVGLRDQPPICLSWRYLSKLFPSEFGTKSISKVLPGRPKSLPRGDDRMRRIIIEIERTNLVHHCAEAQAGPFRICSFRNLEESGTGSLLVSGEINGRAFSVAFFAKASFGDHFINDLDAREMRFHLISGGDWKVFLPVRPQA